MESVLVQGLPLDLTKSYKVATIDYVFNGGDDYEMFKGGRVILSPLQEVSLISTVSAYIKQMGDVATFLEGRIVEKGALEY